MSDRVGAAWREFQSKIIPADAPAVQLWECRRAFYAGANALFAILVGGVGSDPDEPPTVSELRMMDEIKEEFEYFAKQIAQGQR